MSSTAWVASSQDALEASSRVSCRVPPSTRPLTLTPEQPDAGTRIDPVEQLLRDPGDRRPAAHRVAGGPRPGDGAEVAEAHLQRDGAPAEPVARAAGRRWRRPSARARAGACRDGSGRAANVSSCPIDLTFWSGSTRRGSIPLASWWRWRPLACPSARQDRVDGQRGEVADGPDGEPVEPALGRRADAPQRADRQRVEEGELLARPDHGHPGPRRRPRRCRPGAWPPASRAWPGTCCPPPRPSRPGRGARARRPGWRAAISTAEPWSRRAPATSRNASSSDSGSTSGVYERNTSITPRLTSP